MARYSWKLTPGILGLSLLTVSPGFSSSWKPENRDALNKSMVESAVLALVSARLTRSYWPLAAPVLYLGFDYMWNTKTGTEGL